MSTRAKALIAVAVVVVALIGGGLWWFLRDDSPPEVSLEDAIESVDSTTSTAGDGSTDTSEATADGVEGTWVVDAESGEFDFESATGTFAGFRIQEELAAVGSTTAVGRTGEVGGEITIEGTTLTEATFDVDLTTITTNEARRDDRVQGALDTEQFPTATFTLTEPVDLGAAATDGEPVAVTAAGELTIKGVTQPVDVAIEAQLVEGTIVLVGSTELTFADFGVEVPSAPVVLSVSDTGTMEVQILLVPA